MTFSRRAAGCRKCPIEDQENLAAHASYMNDLEKEGFIVLGGPLEGTRRPFSSFVRRHLRRSRIAYQLTHGSNRVFC